MDERELTQKRLTELGKKSENAPYFIFTDFLGLMEQAIFHEVKSKFKNSRCVFFGGAPGTERIIVRFGDEAELGYSEPFPIATVKVEPLSMKFAEKLTHRDFLGSILALGIERSKVGDIVIRDNVGYVFVKEEIADYVIDSLAKIKRTDVRASLSEAALEGELYKTERRKIQAQGERVDAIVAKLFSISREDSLSLFRKGLVFADGRQLQSPSYIPRENEVISVRGYGRFIYLGYGSLSKKGKLNIEVDLYI